MDLRSKDERPLKHAYSRHNQLFLDGNAVEFHNSHGDVSSATSHSVFLVHV